MTEVLFRFEGHEIAARPGDSLAAALTRAGHRGLRLTAGEAERGIFCGMGVCQDCLVTVDGTPNRRACMTEARSGMVVRRQTPFPEPAAPGRQVPAAITLAPDVLVIGGGAGGLSAGIAAAERGASVVLLDERKVPGGQFYKQPADGHLLDAQQAEGAALLARARRANVHILQGVEVWGAFDGLRFLAHKDGAPVVVRPRAAIVATGAYERPLIVPGWTLPGVMTTGAAQTLWRSYRALPGRRVLLAGSGPLNVQVALELLRGGAEVVGIAERAPHPARHGVATALMALADPRLTLSGLAMMRELARHRVPVWHATELTGIAPGGDGLRATLRSRGRTRTVDLDALCMNAGFEPQNEILRLLGAAMRYDPAVGHLRCLRDDTMRTSVAGLYAIGDCTGLGGAPAARLEGQIAGASAAAATGHGDAHDLYSARRALARQRRFQRRLWQVFDISPQDLTAQPEDTQVCRCEELSLGALCQGLVDAPGHVGTVKRATRLGMGRCQGRYCGPAAARLAASATGRPIEEFSFFAPRVPIKPVEIATIVSARDALSEAG